MIGAIIGGAVGLVGSVLGATTGSKDSQRQLEAARLQNEALRAEQRTRLQIAELEAKQVRAQQLMMKEQAANAEDLAKLGLIGVSIVALGAAGVAVIVKL